ncbi:uncharacterized protein LOC123523671 [Mercenaria mercenaria]|uniref:uncharacterized protein LOC123523671 n=1 Tax=Mercenaria mercenaria TaxID=6596 RepID=UPI00234FA7BA|nr:uncharacterized protein LOC123523671 [Mercenaria mercenaria]
MSFIREITAIRGKNVPIFVVGNKADTEERDVNPEIADYEVTMNYECTHVEVCALDGDGLKDLFSCLLGHLGQYLVNPTKDESVEDKNQSLRKRLSNYFRKKLSTLNTF